MVHGIWPHIGKNVKRKAHQSERAARRSMSTNDVEICVIDKYDHHSGREYMAPIDHRKSNRRKMTVKKQERDRQRDSKLATVIEDF